MGTNVILWLAALGTCSVFAMQWIVLRSKYLKGITQQRARHQQHQQATQQQLEQAKRQIGHLQHELSLTKQQIARLAAKEHASTPERPRPAAAPQVAREDSASPRRALPVDGFADTLPTPQFLHEIAFPQH